MATHIPLSLLARALRDFVNEPPKYRTLYSAILDGHIPARKNRSGRWEIAVVDLKLIAKTLCPDANVEALRKRPVA